MHIVHQGLIVLLFLKKAPPKRKVVDPIHTRKGFTSRKSYNGRVGVKEDKEIIITDNGEPRKFIFFVVRII